MLQFLAPTGAAGIAHIYDFAGKAIAEWHQRSEAEKPIDQSGNPEAMLEKNFLDSLLAKHRRSPDAFSVNDAYYHIVPNVSAGGETTGIALSATMNFLCRNPEKLENLRRGLESMKKGKTGDRIAMKDAQDCSYLQAVIKESLRLFPATGLGLSRVVSEGGLNLAGYFFPEGVSFCSAPQFLQGQYLVLAHLQFEIS